MVQRGWPAFVWNDEARKERRVVQGYMNTSCVRRRPSGGWGCGHEPGEGGAVLMGWGARAGWAWEWGDESEQRGAGAPPRWHDARDGARERWAALVEHTSQHVSPRRGEPRRAWWEAAVDVGRGGELQDCVRSCSPKEPPGAGRRSARERGEATVCGFTHTEEVRSSVVTRGHERIERSRVTRQRLVS